MKKAITCLREGQGGCRSKSHTHQSAIRSRSDFFARAATLAAAARIGDPFDNTTWELNGQPTPYVIHCSDRYRSLTTCNSAATPK
jgi:hypothetical protein